MPMKTLNTDFPKAHPKDVQANTPCGNSPRISLACTQTRLFCLPFTTKKFNFGLLCHWFAQRFNYLAEANFQETQIKNTQLSLLN